MKLYDRDFVNKFVKFTAGCMYFADVTTYDRGDKGAISARNFYFGIW
jgi:hypothetical protein